MADNIVAGAAVGTGPTFRTDDLGAAGHAPYAKLLDGTNGGTDGIPGDATNGLYVNVKAAALPTGAATSAKQDTEITVLQAIQTAVQGTLTVTWDGGGTEYTEDAAAAANPVGTALILVREDARAGSLTTTDGDNVALRGNNKGEAYVKDTDAGTSLASIDGKITAVNTGAVVVSSSALPSGAATSAKQDTQTTHLATLAGAVAGTEIQADVITLPNVTLAAGTNTNEMVGDVAHDAAIAGNPLTIGGVASAAAPADVSADQDAVRSWHLRNGAQAVNLTAAGALIPGDATNGLDVDVTRMAALVAGTAVIGKVGIDQTTPGTTNLVALAANQSVNVAQINGVTALMGNGVTGTGSQRVTIASDNTAFSVNATAVGQAAHDAAIAGSPVRVAARGMSADYTAVATGDTADVLASLLGKTVTLPYALPGNTWNYAAPAGGLVSTTAVTIKAAAGAGIRNYLTSLQVINSHATISTELMVLDGAAGTVLWRGWAQAAGGGIACTFDPPLRGTANTLLEIDEVTATATAGVLVNAQGFVAAE